MFAPDGFVSVLELILRAIGCPNTVSTCIRQCTTAQGEHTDDHPGFFDMLESKIFLLGNYIGFSVCSLGHEPIKVPAPLPHKVTPEIEDLRDDEFLVNEKAKRLFWTGVRQFGFEPTVHHRSLIQADILGEKKFLSKHPADMWAYKSIPAYHERGTYTIDTTWAEFLRENGYFAHDFQLLPSLSHVRGATLCLEAKWVEEHWLEVFGETLPGWDGSFDEEREAGITHQVRAGRPDKSRKGAKAFLEIYPEGRVQTPWKEVLKRVGEKTGEPIGVDALKRGLDALGYPNGNPSETVVDFDSPKQPAAD